MTMTTLAALAAQLLELAAGSTAALAGVSVFQGCGLVWLLLGREGSPSRASAWGGRG